MLSSLKFVQGAVSHKDLVPELSHFQIKDGRISGYNGVISLSAPIDLDIETNPRAKPFIKAVEHCEEQAVMYMTKGGKLAIKSGKFRAYLSSLPQQDLQEFKKPSGEPHQIPEGFIAALKAVKPFIGVDASRPWSHGTLVKNGSLFATNNICFVEQWLGYGLPTINIPSKAVAELVRINEQPVAMSVEGSWVTFFFEGDRWLSAHLYATDWPDVADRLFEDPGDPQEFPQGFWEAFNKLKPFLGEDNAVYLKEDQLSTSQHEEDGTTVDIEGVMAGPIFNYKVMSLLQGIATAIDLDSYPKPCQFTGGNLRGVIVGMRG